METLTFQIGTRRLAIVAEPVVPFRKTILFVDPDETSYKLVSVLFAGYNTEIVHAKNGVEAILLFRDNPSVSLVITELSVPGMDGFSILKSLRKINPRIPVIAQTTQVHENIEQKCIEEGFDEYISKPVDLRLLEVTVKKYEKLSPRKGY